MALLRGCLHRSHTGALWQKFKQFESAKDAFQHCFATVLRKWGDNMTTGLAANFVIVGSLLKNISLPRDMKYTGFGERLPGIQEYFITVGIPYSCSPYLN